MRRGQQLVEVWPWLPRQGRPPVPVGVLVFLLALAFALFLLLAWLLSGAQTGAPVQQG